MDWKTFSDELTQMIRPQSFPLGVKLFKDVNELPEKATRPAKYGVKISLCQWTTMARRWGRVLAATAEDINCTPCLAALGLKRMAQTGALADYFMEMGYFADAALAEKAVAELGTLPPGQFAAICFFPLHMAPVDPDGVFVYGSPAQMSRLAAGFLYHAGGIIESRTTLGISCLSALKPVFTGRPALVHPGRGERILAGTDEGEMLFSFPAASGEALIDGLRQSHARGSRYPVQSYLIYEPPLLPAMRHLGETLADAP
jgi:uncharacterized protein (DUF169 family)